MERIELAADSRKVTGKKVKLLRGEGLVPGVLYGPDIKSLPLQFKERDLNQVLNQAGTSLINLKIDEAGPLQLALVRDLQRDALTQRILHIDFMAIKMTEKVNLEIPIYLTGTREGEGVLFTGVNEIEIEALPDKLIASVEIDISDLEIGDTLYVSDLEIPEGVEVLTDPEEMIVNVTYVSMEIEEEEEEELEAPIELGEVEVIGREVEDEEEFFEEEE